MSKPNFLTKAAEFFGFSTENVELMTAEETVKLESHGEKIIQLETVAAEAEAQRDLAISEREELKVSLEAIKVSLSEKEAEIQALTESVSAKDTKITELEKTISELPGDEGTGSASTADSNVGEGKTEKVIRSWEAPLYRK